MSRPAKWAKRIMVTAGAACAIPETDAFSGTASAAGCRIVSDSMVGDHAMEPSGVT
jgi:hypothetical protein